MLQHSLPGELRAGMDSEVGRKTKTPCCRKDHALILNEQM
jgi:hypothetical protein